MNDDFLCIGLQNYNKGGQKNGFAIIHIKKKDINRIIKDLSIYSLSFNSEKKLLYSAMDSVQKGNKNHQYMIGIYEVVEGIGEIYLNNICKIKSKHTNIIVSLSEIINKKEEENGNNDQETIIISASIDCTLRINKINN